MEWMLDMIRTIHATASEHPDRYDWNSRHGLVTNSPGHTAGRGTQRLILHFAAEGVNVELLRFLLYENIVPPVPWMKAGSMFETAMASRHSR